MHLRIQVFDDMHKVTQKKLIEKLEKQLGKNKITQIIHINLCLLILFSMNFLLIS